jgi:hypothetical protein
MPKQSPLRLVKGCRLYERRGDWGPIPPVARGLYVLYKTRLGANGRQRIFKVTYIGVGGISKTAKSGIGGRIKGHHKSKSKSAWSHYSFFEVHDNVSREEILELEGLLLHIFRDDPRIKLANVQFGSSTFKTLSRQHG